MAGRRNRYGYQEYRGRSGARLVLIFIIVLLAVLLAAGAAFMALMGDYIKYTDTGLEIDLPWLNDEPSAPPEISDPVVVVSDDVVVTVEPEPTEPEPEPSESEPEPVPPEPQYEAIGAVTVTAAQLRDGSAAAAVAAAGGNALVVEMKAADGRLAWQSQAPLAASLGVNAADDRTAQAVRELSAAGGVYLVARVHCFKDPVVARAWIGPLMTLRGAVWYDRVGVCWTSPANQQTVDYLSQLCMELADMGFDEILLDDAGYPWDGEVNVLATSENRPEDRTVPVAAFYARLAGELEGREVCLSVYASERLLEGETVYTGMTAAVLAENAGRVWLDKRVDAEHYRTILSAAGLEDVDARVVVENASAGSWYR